MLQKNKSQWTLALCLATCQTGQVNFPPRPNRDMIQVTTQTMSETNVSIILTLEALRYSIYCSSQNFSLFFSTRKLFRVTGHFETNARNDPEMTLRTIKRYAI